MIALPDKTSFSSSRWLLAGLLAIFATLVVLIAVGSSMIRQKATLERQETLRINVERAAGVVEVYEERARKGELTTARAKEEAREALRTMSMGNMREYLFITDLQGSFIMHPAKPELEGAPPRQTVDKNGKNFTVEMLSLVQGVGGGFVRYWWTRPGSDEQAEKISYVTLNQEWGWVIGSGIYLDDEQSIIWSGIAAQTAIAAILLAMTVFL